MATAAAPAPDTAATELRRIPLEELHESPWNPRTHFDPQVIQERMESLLASGQFTPILVRPRKSGGYEIGAGHVRFRAAKQACEQHPEGAKHRGLDALQAIVRTMDDRTFIELLNIENLQRDDLDDIDEAEGFVNLMERCGYDIKKVAARIGKSSRYVYDSLALRKLIPEAKKSFLEGRFERGHAILLARLTPEWQKKALNTQFNRYGDGRGALWEAEIFDPEPGQQRLKLNDQVKPVSIREFQTWIDDHVRATPAAVDPVLFPTAADLLAQAQAAKGRAARIIHITYQRQVPYTAKDPNTKTYGAEAWKRADGQFDSKPCDHSVVGFVAAGPRRNDAFLVCVSKETCPVHWREWQRERERRQRERARQDPRGRKGSATVEGGTFSPARKQPALEPPQDVEDGWLQQELQARCPGFVKAIKAIIGQLKISDEIAWNLTGNSSSECHLWSWEKPGHSGYTKAGRSRHDQELEDLLPPHLPGKWRKTYGPGLQPADGTAARAALAMEIWFARDTTKLDDELDKALAARRKAWIEEEKSKRAAKKAEQKPARGKKATAKGKKR